LNPPESRLIDFPNDIGNLKSGYGWRSDCSTQMQRKQRRQTFTCGQAGALLGAERGLPMALPRLRHFCYSVKHDSWAEAHPPLASTFWTWTSELCWRRNVLHDSPFKRSSERHLTKRQASLIMNFRGRLQRHPCLIVDISRGGYRLRGNFQVKRGQLVEVIPKDDPLSVAQCSVIWVGRQGTAQRGQAGLEAMN
jgi:hypothetical protein